MRSYKTFRSCYENFHKLYTYSFVPFEHELVKKTITDLYSHIKYNIKNFIPAVYSIKEILHLLDYEVNFFEYPMHKRYIRLKSSLKPDSPKSSPSKKRARTSGGKKSRKNRGKFKKNKRTKKNLSQKKYNSQL